jgi:hypothetical protein
LTNASRRSNSATVGMLFLPIYFRTSCPSLPPAAVVVR